MKNLHFLVVGKNKEILETLQRIITQNEGWTATLQEEVDVCYDYLKDNTVDILLLSSGLDESVEKQLCAYVEQLDKDVKVISHYGGGSGLLKSEVYGLFPDLAK